jgi:hypothetical protein
VRKALSEKKLESEALPVNRRSQSPGITARGR